MKQPTLSIILCGRNDHYGDDFIDRLERSLSWNAELAARHHLQTELVFVNYHPEKNQKCISQLDIWPFSDYWTTRIITVRAESDDFLEFPAKNIGIRRANGQYFLLSNADILLPENFFRSFHQWITQNNTLYRADRMNVAMAPGTETSLVNTADEYCVKGGIFYRPSFIPHSIYSALLPPYLSARRVVYSCLPFLLRKSEQFLLKHHFTASGDFTLAHRDIWLKLRGFREETPISTHVDSLFLLKALSHQIKIQELPMAVLHQSHDRRHNFSSPSQEMIEMWSILHDQINEYLATRTPTIDTNDQWGNPEINYPEDSIE
ncbi:hypothetical protein [Marinoscillum sp.]|uniref:hypothetical protein n=1 Tax=Marinoscillum sp. TaxID=2024838 RepID=UPI003BA9946A